jgi:sterol desaturase/sphingolipid hydroxylase (fatty acid hydroxylase superfamily)
MVETLALFVGGVFLWTFLEYLIHGWLSHTFRTFVMPLHAVHHRDAYAVFAVRAWLPIALIWTAMALLFGWTSGVILLSGAVAGFAGYEAVHYRIHFRRPWGRLEDYLRSRHLVHHEYYPDRCFGVTSALWDLVFGTEPMGPAMAARCESMRSRPPLNGCINLYELKDSIMFFRLSRRLARPPGRQ